MMKMKKKVIKINEVSISLILTTIMKSYRIKEGHTNLDSSSPSISQIFSFPTSYLDQENPTM